MRIDKMTAASLDAVAAIEAECFSHPWSKKSLEESFEKENSLFLVAYEDGKVIGYVGMEVIVDEGYIFNVAVSADYRRRGVGYALVRELVNEEQPVLYYPRGQGEQLRGDLALLKIRLYQGGREEKLLLRPDRSRCFDDKILLIW